MKIAILQPNYIPWKGYFDIIAEVDEFILLDCVQYTRRDWRNRNKILTPNGAKWLTVPVITKGLYFQKINATVVSQGDWSLKHWQMIERNYSKAKYFNDYKKYFERFYRSVDDKRLSYINFELIKIVCDILGIKTKISWSTDYENIDTSRTEKLMSLCRAAGGCTYLSGPSAKSYFDCSIAQKYNLKIEWMDYSNYPIYKQLHEPFEHSVSILDLIFNEGPNAKNFMLGF